MYLNQEYLEIITSEIFDPLNEIFKKKLLPLTLFASGKIVINQKWRLSCMLLIIRMFSLDLDLGMLKKLVLQLSTLDLLCDSAIQIICKHIFFFFFYEIRKR